MILVNQLSILLKDSMLPVTIEVSESSEGIKLSGKFLGKKKNHTISAVTIGHLNENILIDIVINEMFKIKNDLLNATCDYKVTTGS